jgi:hypothetical protein
MKKLIFVLALATGLAGIAQAQMPEKFVKAMEALVPAVDTTRNVEGLTALAHSFERIADTEKSQWLPYYYAALCHTNAGLMMTGGNIMAANADKTDPVADKAEMLLGKAEALVKENSEILVVKKMILTLRMMGDAMNRFMIYGPEAATSLGKAKALNPENPRVYILEGQDKFYTPEEFGGSKAEAKKLFETAQQKFESFKPESSIHPSWGLPMVKHFLSQAQ